MLLPLHDRTRERNNMKNKTPKISREDKKAEAIERMKALNILPETIRQFEQDGLISVSESPVGAFYHAEGEALERIRKFEEENNVLVYLVVRGYSDSYKMDNYIFVNDYRDEWEMDRQEISNPSNGIFAYAYNYDVPEYSEFGSIGVRGTVAAGLQRIW